jgi:hypothetical protein
VVPLILKRDIPGAWRLLLEDTEGMSAARDWAVGPVIIALTAAGLAVEFFARSSGFG